MQSEEITEKEKIIEENKKNRAEKEDEIREIFAERLATARRNSGKNKNTISKDTGIALSMLGSYESAGKTASVTTAKLLADYLGVSLDWLCGAETDNMTPRSPDDWQDIPPVYAFVTILDKYNPLIEFGDRETSPYITMSFNNYSSLDTKELALKKFIQLYKMFCGLAGQGIDCDEYIDKLLTSLIKEYENKL